MKTLYDTTTLGTIRLRNRLVRSATWEAMADDAGRPTPRLIRVYRELMEGGTGFMEEKIVEIMLLISVYAGFPAALNGILATREVADAIMANQ